MRRKGGKWKRLRRKARLERQALEIERLLQWAKARWAHIDWSLR